MVYKTAEGIGQQREKLTSPRRAARTNRVTFASSCLRPHLRFQMT